MKFFKVSLMISLMIMTRIYSNSLPSIDFDKAMQKGSKEYTAKFITTKDNQGKIELLKDLFSKNYHSRIRPKGIQRIPRIIHQIWVGGKPVPSKYMKLMKSWIVKHPTWKHRLWLDKDVEQLTLRNRVYYDATSDPIEKANLVRYEILEQMGGLYVDIDFLCLKSLECFHERYDFYTGIAPLDCVAMLNNALIACGPQHPIIKHCIDTVKDDIHRINRFERTGVRHFSRSFFATYNIGPGVTIALPVQFFYPGPG